MKVQINFKIMNPDFNQDYANEYNLGKESDGNRKYNWAEAYSMENIDSVELLENEDYLLKGKLINDEEFEHTFSNVLIYRCHFGDGSKEDFVVSKSILNKTHEAKMGKYNTTRFYFYINLEPASIQLVSNLIIDERDVPEEFVKSENE